MKNKKTTFGKLKSGAEFEFLAKPEFKYERFNRLTETTAGTFINGRLVLVTPAASEKVLEIAL